MFKKAYLLLYKIVPKKQKDEYKHGCIVAGSWIQDMGFVPFETHQLGVNTNSRFQACPTDISNLKKSNSTRNHSHPP